MDTEKSSEDLEDKDSLPVFASDYQLSDAFSMSTDEKVFDTDTTSLDDSEIFPVHSDSSISIDAQLFEDDAISLDYSGKSLRQEMLQHDPTIDKTVSQISSDIEAVSDNLASEESEKNSLDIVVEDDENAERDRDSIVVESEKSLDRSEVKERNSVSPPKFDKTQNSVDIINQQGDKVEESHKDIYIKSEKLLDQIKQKQLNSARNSSSKPSEIQANESSCLKKLVKSSPSVDLAITHQLRTSSLKKQSISLGKERPILKPVSKQRTSKELSAKTSIKSQPTADERYSLWPGRSPGFGTLNLMIELERRQTKDSSKSSILTEEKPKAWAWVVVTASLIVMIPIAGVLSCYGVMVPIVANEFNATRLETGCVGSMAFAFMVGSYPVSNVLMSEVSSQVFGALGLIGAAACAALTSLVPNIYLMFLTYSFLLGTFANTVFVSILTIASQYFSNDNNQQALASCLATVGVPFGILSFNPIARKVLELLNWRHTFQILGGCILAVGLICIPFLRPPSSSTSANFSKNEKQNKPLSLNSLLREKVTPQKQNSKTSSSDSNVTKKSGSDKKYKTNTTRKFWDYSLCSNFSVILWMTAIFLLANGYVFPLIYLIDHMRTFGVDSNRAAIVLTSYGAADFCGRFLCALYAQKLPVSLAYLYAFMSSIGGAITFIVPFWRNLPTMYAYAIVSGINSGVVNSLMFAATMQFFGKGKGQVVLGYVNIVLAIVCVCLGLRYVPSSTASAVYLNSVQSMEKCILSAGMLAGSAVAGVVYDVTQSYRKAFYINGLLFIFCSVIMALLPTALKSWPLECTPVPSAVTVTPVEVKRSVSNLSLNQRRGKKRSLRRKSEESLRRKVLRLSFTKDVLAHQAAELSENVTENNTA